MRVLFGGIGLIMVVTACAIKPGIARVSPSANSIVISPSALSGAWRIVSLNGAPARGSASFDDRTFTLNFGCNTMRGSYAIHAGRWHPAGLYITERGCLAEDGSDAPMQLEERGFAIARQPAEVRLESVRVTFSNDAGHFVLER